MKLINAVINTLGFELLFVWGFYKYIYRYRLIFKKKSILALLCWETAFDTLISTSICFVSNDHEEGICLKTHSSNWSIFLDLTYKRTSKTKLVSLCFVYFISIFCSCSPSFEVSLQSFNIKWNAALRILRHSATWTFIVLLWNHNQKD